MRAVVLPRYSANLVRAIRSLEFQDIELPELSGEQVLVKVKMTPCNPSDIAFLRGMYNIRREKPIVPGFEATGEVVSAGYMREARDLLGNRISCFVQDANLPGTWAEYAIAHWQDCIELRKNIPDEQAATLGVNPFTAYALFDIVKAAGKDAFIQDAASGQVGMFLRNMARKEGIRVVNIVRKEEQVKSLQNEGEKYVLNMNADDFEEELSSLAHEMQVKIAFDAVGGETSGTIFNAMPAGGKLILYGGLSGQRLSNVETMDLIFHNKDITGFNLGDWKHDTGQERFIEIALELEKMIMDGTIQTMVQGSFGFENIQEGLIQYIKNMSAGKVLIAPGS
jgi:NADPH:quinone reductase-like Zn-dependent oxidoreductase